MAGRLATFLKDAWAKEPVLVASFTIGGLAVILPTLSPFTKYATMINQATPYNYPGEWELEGWPRSGGSGGNLPVLGE
uniref:NADH dehydrogenase [ubiquinone] 1 alpha subcomplex subunit 3 n=1 Tax=Ailuropoda melanoleuca TaxID=9646 RepID=A0A7N5JL68_AILME